MVDSSTGTNTAGMVLQVVPGSGIKFMRLKSLAINGRKPDFVETLNSEWISQIETKFCPIRGRVESRSNQSNSSTFSGSLSFFAAGLYLAGLSPVPRLCGFVGGVETTRMCGAHESWHQDSPSKFTTASPNFSPLPPSPSGYSSIRKTLPTFLRAQSISLASPHSPLYFLAPLEIHRPEKVCYYSPRTLCLIQFICFFSMGILLLCMGMAGDPSACFP